MFSTLNNILSKQAFIKTSLTYQISNLQEKLNMEEEFTFNDIIFILTILAEHGFDNINFYDLFIKDLECANKI